MISKHFLLLTMVLVTGACASNTNIENIKQTRQNIDVAMEEAASVEPARAQVPPADIFDELAPGSGVSVSGLSDDIRQEDAFDISVANAPAGLFFMSLVKDTDINMVVHPSVSGEISLDLKHVTVAEVMALVREVYGYEFKHTSRGFVVMPSRIQSKIFPVNYLNVRRMGESSMTVSSGQLNSTQTSASSESGTSSTDTTSSTAKSSSINTSVKADFWTGLQKTITSIVGNDEGRSVVVDSNAGLVIVRAMPSELRDVEAYLNNAEESMQRQVILETKIIEVKLSDSFQSGIDWAVLASGNNFLAGNAGVVNGSTQVFDSTTGIAKASAVLTGGGAFANLFAVGGAAGDFGALLRLLGSQGEVQVLSSPRISTVNNQKAVIKVGSDEFFVTDVSSSTSASSGSTTTTPDITLTPFFSGIALDVTPQISVDGDVILHIHPSVSEITDQVKNITVGGQTQQLPLAYSTVRESDSIIKARNGQVVVIGGLMQNSSNNEDGGVPGMSDLPFVGGLFKQKRVANSRSELVILLRPIVVESNKVWSNYVKDSAGRIKRLNTTEGE